MNFFKGYLENKTIALITFICLSALLILIPLGVLAPIYLLVSGLVALTLGCSLAVFPLMLSKLKYQEDINKEDNAEEELANAKLHDPDLPRNATMDIYNPDNAIDLALTQTEVYTYYKVMRCLVKNKKLIPDEDKEFKHCKGRSKREVLLASQDPENQNLPITLKITKAKAIHMRHTLNLVDRIGLEHEGELKRALEQEYEHYRLGKSAGFS